MLGESKIVDHFVEQAKWCDQLGSPFTAQLLIRFAEDFEADGPVATLCKDWPTNPRKDALGLRLTGALHYAVLSGAAPEMAALYPGRSSDWQMERVWPKACAWLSENLDHVRAFIQSPPQTNETRRSIILLPGFLKIAARFQQPMQLLELGASAGLNQHWDRFSYQTGTWQRAGDSDVVIKTDWRAPVPNDVDVPIRVATRAACDLSPVNISDPDQVLRLKSYTWPDQHERLLRLQAAIELAQEAGTHVEKADAAAWLAQRLATRPEKGVTVIFHSVFLIYPPREVIGQIMATIEAAGRAATPEAPIAWLCYESEALFGGDTNSPKMRARLQTWPSGDVDTYAESDGHVTYVEPYPAGT